MSSADIESLAGRSVPWANSDTGTRGVINGLVEFKREGLLCRRFSTSRESFDGVALFKGEACMVSARRLAHAGVRAGLALLQDAETVPGHWNFFLVERI